jgi:anti-sigma regulatory factor (Ser/Thr protein kinase)
VIAAPSSRDRLIDATTLAPDASTPSRARRFVELALHRWNCAHVGDDVALLTSELVTNAVLHARSPVRVAIARVAGGVRVEVGDGSINAPVVSHYPLDAQTGRGLAMVDAAASAWGVDRRDGGKVVWFEVRV